MKETFHYHFSVGKGDLHRYATDFDFLHQAIKSIEDTITSGWVLIFQGDRAILQGNKTEGCQISWEPVIE